MRFREIRTKKRAVRAWMRGLLRAARETGRAMVPGFGPTRALWVHKFPVYERTNRQAKRQRCKAARRERLSAVAS